MVAGMAAIRPIAVANSASAMPGATTASEVFFEAAIDWKLDMMPQTVPKRTTNGPAEPTGAHTRLEDRHDAPYVTEQAADRPGRADGPQHQQPSFQPLDLAGDGDVHHLL